MRVWHRSLLALLMAFCLGGTSFAQDDPTNKQYLFNLLNINPAYAGTRDGVNITAGFKRQWAGIPGAPQTMVFSADAPFKEHHFGGGIQLYTNSLGLERTSGVNTSFATSFNFTEEDFKKIHGEILVFITTFDDMYSNTVAARTSYTFNEIIYGAKFVTMYNRSKDNSKTILYLDKLNQYDTTNF